MKRRRNVQAILVKPMPQTAAIEKEEHLMLKRIFFVIAASLLVLGAVGCACNGGTVSPSPTASMRPVSTPMAAEQSPDAGLSASPDTSSSPDAGAGTGTGGGTGGSAVIPNFTEGTDVKAEDVPEIKSAIEAKYSGATIKSIKHAMQQTQQVYAVEIEQNGKTQTIYVQPDGTILPGGNTAS